MALLIKENRRLKYCLENSKIEEHDKGKELNDIIENKNIDTAINSKSDIDHGKYFNNIAIIIIL